MLSFTKLAFFLVAACTFLYAAAAGWVGAELSAIMLDSRPPTSTTPIIYDGISWVNETAMQRYRAVESAKHWFPWIVGLPQPVTLMMTALAFGGLGGVARAGHDALSNQRPLVARDFATIGLAGLMGLFVLGATYVVPSAIAASNAPIRPHALLFTCTFGGLFHEHFYEWMKQIVAKILGKSP
jgi:hypothetical protein